MPPDYPKFSNCRDLEPLSMASVSSRDRSLPISPEPPTSARSSSTNLQRRTDARRWAGPFLKTSQPRTSTLPTATPLPLPTPRVFNCNTAHITSRCCPGLRYVAIDASFSVSRASLDPAVNSGKVVDELIANCLVITERSQGRRGRLQTRHPQCRPREDLHGPDRLPERYVEQL